MNSRFVPDADATALPAKGKSAATAAIVTPSYAGDFERCRLLCETMDRLVTGASHHYLLVAPHDLSRFRQLENARRTVVDERDLLPPWLHSFRDPTSFFRRHVWLSTRTLPLRGWHVQQLRRIAIARHAGEDTLIYCDSDVVFLKAFDCGRMWRDGLLRLYRQENASRHRAWSTNAGNVLGLPAGPSPHDYITTLIGWRRETVTAMIGHIEARTGRNWVEAVASSRNFSECLLYGRFVDEVLGTEGHFHDGRQLCRVYWIGPKLSEDGIRRFIDEMEPHQVAIGMQSFIGMDVDRLRRLVG
ncbi:MAG TPA: DUF6492 family protein [Rhizobiaceae bacterium]|nr:DUF6492 family protein [Rhizobiaceae bacterium]